jgi:hypothetical protein
MKKLDQQTLDALADLICGDAGPFYRRGWELAGFFRRASLSCPDHDGSTRKWWALERLREFNETAESLENVILRLANPREYKGDSDITHQVIAALNKILAIEGLQVHLAGVIPKLIVTEPSLPPSKEKTVLSLEPPDFADITNDPTLGAILTERWNASQICIDAEVYVSAIITMGSLLEGTLFSVITTRKNLIVRAPARRIRQVSPNPFKNGI